MLILCFGLEGLDLSFQLSYSSLICVISLAISEHPESVQFESCPLQAHSQLVGYVWYHGPDQNKQEQDYMLNPNHNPKMPRFIFRFSESH